MKYFTLPLLFMLITASFLSCDKDDDDQPQTCPQTVASIAATYKLTSQRYRPAGGAETEIIGSLNACERDNLLILNSNKTFIHQDAGVVCSPAVNYAGDWDVTGSTIRLETETGTITSFDCRNLVFYVNHKPSAGDRMTYTYTKQ